MIVRSKRRTNFTIVDNQLINDSNLKDWAELGLLVYLLSKPDDWEISPSHLAKQRKASKNTIYRLLGELREAGYCTVEKHSDGTTDWVIYDEPNPKNRDQGKPHPKNPDHKKPDQGFCTQLNTDSILNTDSDQSSGTNVPGAGAPPVDLSEEEPELSTEPENKEISNSARVQIWRIGIKILTDQGMTESPARAFIGKQAKLGEKKLASLIGECAAKTPVNARAYIAAAMQNAYNLYDEQQLRKAAKEYGVPPKQSDTYDTWRERVRQAMKGRVAA